MRIRTIKPEFFNHPDLYDIEVETGLPVRIAFAGLWCAADREGRFKWEPRRLKLGVLPYDDLDFSRVLDALATRGLLVKYRVGTAWFGCIPTFSKHQHINHRESSSNLPSVDEADEVVEPHASTTRQPRVTGTPGGKGKEGKGRERKESTNPRVRDACFDALAECSGSKPSELTKRAAKACGVAMAEIRKATLEVTPEEIARRARHYEMHFEAALTPSALANQWAKCANPPTPGKNGSSHASLGALQMQLRKVEEEIEDIIRPGGSAFKVTPTGKAAEKYESLMKQRNDLKTRIEAA